MEFGLFTEFPSPPGVTEAAAFDDALAQMKAAEDLGFDAVCLAEIHFQKDRSVLAAPLVIASALAACTRRVKIGIAVQVLPLSHPLRLAEDVATVDHLTRGRLEFGVGRSGLPGHYQGFNIPYSESRQRFLETLEILIKAWTQDRFSYAGKHFHFRDAERRMRLLEGLWHHAHVAEVEVLSRVGEAVLRPGLDQDLEGLEKALATLAVGNVETLVVPRQAAPP